jgi:hypothetical protein
LIAFGLTGTTGNPVRPFDTDRNIAGVARQPAQPANQVGETGRGVFDS